MSDRERISVVIDSEKKDSRHHHSHYSTRSTHHGRQGQHKNDIYKKSLKGYFKRNRKKIPLIFVSLLIVAALLLLASIGDKNHFKNSSANSIDVNASTIDSIKIELPFFADEISLANPGVLAVMKMDSSTVVADVLKTIKVSSGTRLDMEIPVTLSYSINGIPSGCSLKTATFLVSEDKEFTDSIAYEMGNKTSIKVYHLKPGTKYYYKLNLSFSGDNDTSAIGSFRTAESPRILSIEGAVNVRDIGGWNTRYGIKIKHGLLYRGSELDGAVMPNYTATSNGINVLRTILGVKSDFDLRSPEENVNEIDALGSNVQHKYYSASMYSYVFTPGGKSAVKKLFTDLANENNYPIYMHCTHGLDRTGTMTYLLEAVLGVSEENLMRDCQLSALYHDGLWAYDQMLDFISQLKTYPGDNINQKAENFLKSAGVTQAEIDSIRHIFLGI